MKKRVLGLSGAALAIFLFSGCAMLSPVESTAPGPGAVEGEYLDAVYAKGERMLNAFMNKDAKAFTAELSGDAALKFTEKEFEASQKIFKENMGEMTGFKFLTRLEAPVFETYLWKTEFSRTNSEEKQVKQETVFRLVVAQDKEGKPAILSFGFL